MVAIFVFGVVTGLAGAFGYVHHLMGAFHGHPHRFEGAAVQLLDWELDLDAEQEEAIAEIIGDVHLDLLRFKNEHVEEIEGIVGGGLERIESTLSADQLEDWQRLRQRIEEHLRAGTPPD